MNFETLLVTSDAVATVTLNRPKVLNALNTQMLRELDEAFAALALDATVRVILLRGAGGKAFAAGADISELATASASTGQQLAESAQRIFRRIETLGKPVLALIDGFALGGGCELAMACTLRIASQLHRASRPARNQARPHPGLGRNAAPPRLVGRGAVLKLLLTGTAIDAAEALRIGLVDEIVEAAATDQNPDPLGARAAELARVLAQQPPLAVATILEAVDQGADLPLDQALALEASLFGRLCATEDMREGTRAFLEKRAPNWTGR